MTKIYYSKKDDNFNNAKKDFIKALELNKGANKGLQSEIYKKLFKMHIGYVIRNLQDSKLKDKEISFEDMYNILEEAKSYSKDPNNEKLINSVNIDLLLQESKLKMYSNEFGYKTKEKIKEAIESSIKHRIASLYSKSCNLMGQYYSEKRLLDEAIKYYTKAIEGF